MNDETQRAVLDYINKNFTTSGMDDVAYFANREFLAKEQDLNFVLHRSCELLIARKRYRASNKNLYSVKLYYRKPILNYPSPSFFSQNFISVSI